MRRLSRCKGALIVAPMRILYKILPAAAWDEASAAGRFGGSPVDLQDGFIHLSAAHQVRETAARHFSGQEGLVLVAFREEELPAVKWEPSRGGDLFPHAYAPIETRLAVSVDPLPLEAGGHRFPAGLA